MQDIKIMVVDDESRMRKLVRDFLTREGFQVIEAADGEAAVDLFYENKDVALIILADLPGNPGREQGANHHADSQGR